MENGFWEKKEGRKSHIKRKSGARWTIAPKSKDHGKKRDKFTGRPRKHNVKEGLGSNERFSAQDHRALNRQAKDSKSMGREKGLIKKI